VCAKVISGSKVNINETLMPDFLILKSCVFLLFFPVLSFSKQSSIVKVIRYFFLTKFEAQKIN
jgi:hypothetical protein